MGLGLGLGLGATWPPPGCAAQERRRLLASTSYLQSCCGEQPKPAWIVLHALRGEERGGMGGLRLARSVFCVNLQDVF